ncbi:MAG: restriction endonuclease, partial [Clostridia bacterium]|nr:restriction endonuclease [Clostridia bacterium]
AVKTVEKTVEKPVGKVVKGVPVSELKGKRLVKDGGKVIRKITERPMTADEKLREAFLKRMRSLGGDYFEYYSVYLLERYSMKNGRRLEGLKISGGERDGGIDGEIELTDKLGFKETIYIQSKNWNPEKGDEKLWVVGETILQQFIGACACRQAKDGKQHCRGIFITTSRFTPEAKRILDTLSDKIVGYDGNDLYEAAKECSFGVIQKNGEWVLDERLLIGSKIFFNLY